MSLRSLIRLALSRLTASPARAALTILGIVIGVASVVALTSAGRGATSGITNRLSGLGGTTVTIRPTNGAALTLDDAYAIASLSGVSAVSPTVSSNGSAKFGLKSSSPTVIGATPAAETASKIEPWAGAFLPVLPSGAAPRIAVVGSTVATDLGLTAHDLGSAISINGVPYTVIGLLQQKGGFGIDTAIYVPLDTARTYITGGLGVDSIAVTTTPDSTVANVEAEATAELHARHRIGTGKTDDFTVTDLTQILSTVTAVQGTLVMLLAGIAGISLLVGGIGVMNIMLVSVRERTREIGVRRAIGARRRDILIQFLVESMVLTFVGGLIGILFGEVAAAIIARIGGWEFTVDIATIGIATAVSVIVGVVFGVLPARQASRLDPVEALRYE